MQPLTIFAVDDDPMMLDVMTVLLSTMATVECFRSAEACREGLTRATPDLMLLDVCMDGMNGYDFCRELKDDAATAVIPVIFVSAQDTLDDRLAGYDAGGEDFIVKPFEHLELQRKVQVAKLARMDKLRLKEEAAAAEELSSLALASMDEGSIVLQFVNKLIGWDSEVDIAKGMTDLLHRFGLHATVQTRIGGRAYTVSPAGVNVPLEVSILQHVTTMERIFEFGNRSVYNYDRLTIMISNMPLDDFALCGRIRDNVAIAAQGADARLTALDDAEGRQRSQSAMLEAFKSLEATLASFEEAHKRQRLRYNDFIFEMERELAASFVHLGLTMGQERHLEDMVRRRMQELMELTDQGDALETLLSTLLQDLSKLRQ
jgi:DNA-binding response OmpR family regulator